MDACSCPLPVSLTAIDALDCGIDLGQIQKLGFQRQGFTFDAAATPPQDILELSTWQALLVATDDTKVVVTPFIGGDPIITPGDAITNGGGDNSTLNGVEEVEGKNPSVFTAFFKSLTPAIQKQIATLECEKSLTVYLFLQGGKIGVFQITAGPDTFRGFEAKSFVILDRANNGFGTKDTNSISFSLPAGWSANLQVITPNFNPLNEL